MPYPLWPRCAGQVGLLFPLGGIWVNFFGNPFMKKTADEIGASEAAFRRCFTSAGFGYCLGILIGFVILCSFYAWVGRNSLAANTVNTILALALVVYAVVVTAQYGIPNPWGLIICLGWVILALIGLYQSSTAKSV